MIMKALSDYTIRCTSEQACKAMNLGVILDICNWRYVDTPLCTTITNNGELIGHFMLPTAEQMLGWLRQEHNIHARIDCEGSENYVVQLQFINSRKDINIENPNYKGIIGHKGYPSAPEATLAAIDVALEYLSKNKK